MMPFNNMKKIVLIGLGPQGLFLLREFSRSGCTVIAVGRQNEIAAHSRYGEKLLIDKEEDIRSKLTELAGTNPEKMECHITSGYFLAYLIREFPDLWNMFEVKPSPYDSAGLLINKLATYDLAVEVGIDVLSSPLLSDINIGATAFPVIAKWNQDIHLFSKPGFKTVVLWDRDQLREFSEKYSVEEKEHITIQNYLGSDFDDNISYGGYYTEGDCLAGILVQQKNQYPMGFSSYVVEYDGEHSGILIDKAQALFKQMQFSGFGEAEFKYDRKSGKYYLLEVNPRTWGWVKILKQKYPDIIEVVAGGHVSIENRKCKWVNLLRNLKAAIMRPSSRNWKMLFESMGGSISDIWDSRDMKPFFYQIVRRIGN